MKILTTIIILLFTSLALNAAPSLIGTWQSNKDLSIQSLRFAPGVSDEVRGRVEGLFGKMSVTYSRKQATISVQGEEPMTNDYSVVSSTKSKVSIRWIDPDTGEAMTAILNFVSADRYWVAFPKTPKLSGREYFDRQKK